MTEADIFNRVKTILIDEFELEADSIRPEATLYDELELDSLDSVDLIVALENDFGIKVDRAKDEETLRQLRSINDIISFIQTKLD